MKIRRKQICWYIFWAYLGNALIARWCDNNLVPRGTWFTGLHREMDSSMLFLVVRFDLNHAKHSLGYFSEIKKWDWCRYSDYWALLLSSTAIYKSSSGALGLPTKISGVGQKHLHFCPFLNIFFWNFRAYNSFHNFLLAGKCNSILIVRGNYLQHWKQLYGALQVCEKWQWQPLSYSGK